MNWNQEQLQWEKKIDHLEEKQIIAKQIAKLAKNGDVIGIGSGSTSYLTVLELGKRVKEENLHIQAIPTSYEIQLTCSSLGIPTTTLLEKKPDWCFDGADEVDKQGWLIKGRGAAMFQEKLNMRNTTKTYILIDPSKRVERLGSKFAIPIEIYPKALMPVKQALQDLGASEIHMRMAEKKDGPVITENGNVILDTKFENIEADLESKIKNITGVIENGLFIGYPIEIIE